MLDLSFNPLNSVMAATTALAVLLTYVWLRQHYGYWQQRGIAYIKPTFILGNLKELIRLRTSFGDFFRQLYASDVCGAASAVVGVYWFHTPALVIRNTELIRRILIKDSNMFLNRYEAADAIHDSWGSLTLPLAKYSIWRESRKRMASFFTSGQMKQRMYPLMLAVSLDLERHIERRFMQASGSQQQALIEVKELCALYTTDLTALLTFSIKADSLGGNRKVREAVINMLKPSPQKALNFFLLFFLPQWTSWLRAKVFPANYKKFISKMLSENFKKRNFDLNRNFQNSDYQDDLIDLLLRFQNDARETKRHSFAQHTDFVAAQVAIMLIAGFETSSSLIAFILYELAKQPNLQRKLRNELKNCFRKENAECQTLEYEELQELVYLQMVVAEGLRMYPAAAFINRECTPDGNSSGYSLRPFVDFNLPKGMPAYISILGLQRDEKYWPNPEHFDPERFRPELAASIEPMSYIPFGAGPHSCIGSRLGILQVKLGLAHILKDYCVECTEHTPKRIIFEPTSFMLQNKGGIELKFLRTSD